jgi:hypothetical protein
MSQDQPIQGLSENALGGNVIIQSIGSCSGAIVAAASPLYRLLTK